MNKFYLIIVIALIILAIFILVSCSGKKPDKDEAIGTGGYVDYTDHDAPKIIESKEINSFDYSFFIHHSGYRFGRKILYNNCNFSLEREEDGARCKGYGYSDVGGGEFRFEFLAPLASLDNLQAIIDKYRVSQSNGRYERTIGIPEGLGSDLSVKYASGESIRAYNNSGTIISGDADYNLYDFFIDLAMENDPKLIDSGDMDFELYRLLKTGLISEDGEKTIIFESKEVFVYKEEELLGKGEYFLQEDDGNIEIYAGTGNLGTYRSFLWKEGSFFGLDDDDNSEVFYGIR